jgi:hypothetical protein
MNPTTKVPSPSASPSDVANILATMSSSSSARQSDPKSTQVALKSLAQVCQT